MINNNKTLYTHKRTIVEDICLLVSSNAKNITAYTA